jgi:hypothetical protein
MFYITLLPLFMLLWVCFWCNLAMKKESILYYFLCMYMGIFYPATLFAIYLSNHKP